MKRSPVAPSTPSQDGAVSREDYHAAAIEYRAIHDHLPGGGYVIFWSGNPCGWTLGVEGRPNGWDAGCVAVPPESDGALYVARGGDYITGAKHWEPLS